MKTHNNFTFFWGNSDPFSNWHRPSEFTFRGIQFAQSEQFMMFCKAMIFGDHVTALKIMDTPNPKKNKELGRQVKGFDAKIWEERCYHFVYVGCREKFLQNPLLLMALMATDETELVEASPFDPIWGIGLDENDVRAYDKATWRGKNLLGNILTELREDVKRVGVQGVDRSIDVWWDDPTISQ